MWESCEDRKVFILIEESMKMKNQNITYHFDPPPSSSSSSHYARYSPFSLSVKRALHSTNSSCHVASYCFSYSPKYCITNQNSEPGTCDKEGDDQPHTGHSTSRRSAKRRIRILLYLCTVNPRVKSFCTLKVLSAEYPRSLNSQPTNASISGCCTVLKYRGTYSMYRQGSVRH
jgi:hypothetical protein